MTLYWITSLTTAAPTASFDAIEFTLDAGITWVRRLRLWQTSDLGDAQEEVLRCEWAKGYTTSGSGGQTTVLSPNDTRDTAATAAAEIMNTTLATTTTAVSMDPQGWNIRYPLDLIYPPGEGPVVRTTERIVFRVAAPADAITCNCSMLVDSL